MWTLERTGGNLESEEKKKNTAFDRRVLKDLGLPEDYEPRDENEAYRLIVAWLED